MNSNTIDTQVTADVTSAEKETELVVSEEEREHIARVQKALRREIPAGLPYGDARGWKRDDRRRQRIEEELRELMQLLADLLSPADPIVAEMCANVEEPSPGSLVEVAHVSFRAVRGYHPDRARDYNEIEEAAFDVPGGHTLFRCRFTRKYYILPTDGVYPVVEYHSRWPHEDDDDVNSHAWGLPIHPRLLNQKPEVLQAALLQEARERIGYGLQHLRDAIDYAQIATLHGEEGLRCGGWPAKAFQVSRLYWEEREGTETPVRKTVTCGWTDKDPRRKVV